MDLSSIKSKLNALQNSSSSSKKEKIDYTKVYWKPKAEGKYQIRIVPSKFDKQMPFKEIFMHYGYTKFPILALTNWGEKDPIVEFVKSLRSTNDRENWSLSKKLEPKLRVYVPVLVRGEEDKGIRLWDFGKEIYTQLLGIAEDEDYGDYTDITEGRDFTVEAIMGDIGGRRGLKSSIRIKPKTSALSTDAKEIEKYLNEQPDILQIQRKYEFSALKDILQNFLNPEESTEEEVAEVEEPVETLYKETPFKETPVDVVKVKTKVKAADKFDVLFEDK